MASIKERTIERIIGAISIMDENSVVEVWQDIQYHYGSVEEVDPTPSEARALQRYKEGHEDYVPSISGLDLFKELLAD